MEWITADEHLDHKNIIKPDYCDRPFKTVGEMNETIIVNHNAVVKPNDVVYILGDFALTKKKKMMHFVSRLNGYKILLVGNHDMRFLQRECNTQKIDRFLDFGFDEVYKGIITKDNFILSHTPLYIEEIPCINVGVDAWNFIPIPFPSIKQQINLCAHIHEKWLVKSTFNKGKGSHMTEKPMKIIHLTDQIPSEYKEVSLTRIAESIIGPTARLISGSKSFYHKMHPSHVVYFNANIFTKDDSKIWYGDIDLTFDEEKLKHLSIELDKEVFLLSEMSGRFENEKNICPENNAVWSSKQGPMNRLKDYYDRGIYFREKGKLIADKDYH